MSRFVDLHTKLCSSKFGSYFAKLLSSLFVHLNKPFSVFCGNKQQQQICRYRLWLVKGFLFRIFNDKLPFFKFGNYLVKLLSLLLVPLNKQLSVFHENENLQRVYEYRLWVAKFFLFRVFNAESCHRFFLLFYTFFCRALIPLLLSGLFTIYSFILFKVTLLRFLGGVLIVFLLVYWLLSGFNFFLKRYRFGKFTSALQRFWKRALMCFWLLEGFLFLLFFYYMLNASQEPVFMYDQFSQYVCHCNSYTVFFPFCLFVINILLLHTVLLQLKHSSFRQLMGVLFTCTLIFVYFLQSEAYQFYYILNFYDDLVLTFSEEDNIWSIESDSPWSRTSNHFLTLTLVAKFWHFLFVFVSWVFVIMKAFEYTRVRYHLLAMNIENLILLYIMTWLCMYSWVKFFLRRFLDTAYFWFFCSYKALFLKLLVLDVYAYFFNLIDVFTSAPMYSRFFWRVDGVTFGRGTNFLVQFADLL